MCYFVGQHLSENCHAGPKLGPYIQSGHAADQSNTNLQQVMSVNEADRSVPCRITWKRIRLDS